ncbi:hypothetical protein E2562_008164 [Oryza meyeriana var. granulata]|uniref:Uncharacterized protein n=1 Tax=Oryza meyeriana var. granulata TaxID=110450 RepID=A0A6G1CEW4_9ORYZ|nr:hypothetical protein E2562_008164 [Oryza meyeriana var. granulata]
MLRLPSWAHSVGSATISARFAASTVNASLATSSAASPVPHDTGCRIQTSRGREHGGEVSDCTTSRPPDPAPLLLRPEMVGLRAWMHAAAGKWRGG